MAISEYMKGLRKLVGHTPVMMPGVCAVCFDEAGRVLLQHAKETNAWHLIGGAIDPEEEPAIAAIRELMEESGVRAEPERLLGVYAGPTATYSNGDVVMYTTIAFVCRAAPGQRARVNDDESHDIRFFPPENVPQLDPFHRRVLDDALTKRSVVFDRRARQS
jgi:8-oxo-dGTP pyrophosphatase MutT (NUDIX family)